jgi:osmotically-inducible protein OsmY
MTISKTDPEIQRDVLGELTRDTRIDATDVAVTVDDRVVILTGSVRTWGEKVIAQELAHRVSGVRDVANDIAITRAKPLRTDADIAHAVRDALRGSAFVPETRIMTTVMDGIVTLTGTVDSLRQHDEAAVAIRDVHGVFMVLNNLEIAAPPLDAEQLRSSVEAALRLHAQREAEHITIDVKDGKVALRGTVGSWAERTAISGIVRGTSGVKVIDDHLQIEP